MLVCCDLLNRSVKAWIEGRLLRARLNPLVELHLIVSALWGHKFSSCWVSYWSERSNLKFGKTLQLSSPCKSFTWEMRCKSSIVQLLHLIVINVTYSYTVSFCLFKLVYPSTMSQLPHPLSIYIFFPFLSPVSPNDVLTYRSLIITFLFPVPYPVSNLCLWGFLQRLAPSSFCISLPCFTLSFPYKSSQSLASSFPFSTMSYLLVLQFLWSDQCGLTPHYLSM